ncbi:UNVERIFIED_CONTAM: hypothetical protein K2H54_012043 [Gekko kuhli]
MEAARRADAAFQVPPWLDTSSRGGRRRKRTVFTPQQLDVLVGAFEKNRYPGIDLREALARRIRAPESRVQECIDCYKRYHPGVHNARVAIVTNAIKENTFIFI